MYKVAKSGLPPAIQTKLKLNNIPLVPMVPIEQLDTMVQWIPSDSFGCNGIIGSSRIQMEQTGG